MAAPVIAVWLTLKTMPSFSVRTSRLKTSASWCCQRAPLGFAAGELEWQHRPQRFQEMRLFLGRQHQPLLGRVAEGAIERQPDQTVGRDRQ
jgi:hypothetical protein